MKKINPPVVLRMRAALPFQGGGFCEAKDGGVHLCFFFCSGSALAARFCFFTFMFYLSSTRVTLMPLGTSFGSIEHQRKQNALFYRHGSHFQNIPAVRLQQQTTKRSGCAVHPRIRLIKLIPQMLTIAKGSAFQLKLFRLRLLFTQRGRFLIMCCLTCIYIKHTATGRFT